MASCRDCPCDSAETLGRKLNHTDSICRKLFTQHNSLGRKQEIADSLGRSQIWRSLCRKSKLADSFIHCVTWDWYCIYFIVTSLQPCVPVGQSQYQMSRLPACSKSSLKQSVRLNVINLLFHFQEKIIIVFIPKGHQCKLFVKQIYCLLNTKLIFSIVDYVILVQV